MTDRFWPVELTKQFGPRSIEDFLDWCQRNDIVLVNRHNIHGGSNKMVLSRLGVLERYGKFRQYQENFNESHRAYCEHCKICVRCHESGFPLCPKHETPEPKGAGMLEIDMEDIMKDIRKSGRNGSRAGVWADEIRDRLKDHPDGCMIWGISQFGFEPDSQDIQRYLMMYGFRVFWCSDGERGEYLSVENRR